jgi:hypothetical protein
MANTYSLIASNVLTASASSVTFSSIPDIYTDLVIKISARTDAAGNSDPLNLRINGDTATNYSFSRLTGSSGSVGGAAEVNQQQITYVLVNGNGSTANTFSNTEIYIPSYAVLGNFKQLGVITTAENNSAASSTNILAGYYRNSTVLTSLSFTGNLSNLLTGSSFYLYGIKRN